MVSLPKFMLLEAGMESTSRVLSTKKVLGTLVFIVVLAGLWYVFRPEKLFTTVKVNEAPPVGIEGPSMPLYTARFTDASHRTGGRATVLKQQNGSLILKLSDFSAPSGPSLHILIIGEHTTDEAGGFNPTSGKYVDLGEVQGAKQEQTFQFPADLDLRALNTVVIYSQQSHASIGSAHLEEF